MARLDEISKNLNKNFVKIYKAACNFISLMLYHDN